MSNKRILIIDDEASMRYLLERQLCRSGYTVIDAVDGFAGVSAAQSHTPDLIVLDLMMPGIDGFETFRRLRSNSRTAAIPVIFLSGSVNAEIRRRAFSMGAADVLAKPHQISDLGSVADGVFRRQEALSKPSQKGRVVSLFSLMSGQSSTAMAVYLSRTVALNTTWPVLLIDLDLNLSPVASRLSLHRSPHILQLLDHAPVPMTMEEVAPYVQRQHVGLGVIAAPESPTELDVASLPRLRAAIDELRAVGYYVVIHLGHELTDLALSAMRGSDLVCAMTQTAAGNLEARIAVDDQYDSFLAEVVARGVDAARITPVVGELVDIGHLPQPGQPAAATAQQMPSRMRRLAKRTDRPHQTLDIFL